MNNIIHEIINYQDNIPIKLFYQRIGSVSKHWHSSIEILFVLQGKMTVIIEGTTWELNEDDIFLINPHHIHETHSEDCSLIVVQIRLSQFHLDWAIPENIQFDCNSSAEKYTMQRYFKLKHIIVMLLKNTSTHNEFSQLSTYTYAVELIEELCRNFIQTVPAQAPHSIKYLNRLKSILDYINENYMNPLSLTSIASQEFLTPTYLSAFFEKTMGTTLSSYIMKIRLGHAVSELLSTRNSIQLIASHNGFPSPRAFSSVFKKYYKMLPSEYRKQAGHEGLNSTDNSFFDIQATKPKDLPNTFFENNSLPFLPDNQNSYLELEHYDFLNRLSPYIHEQSAPLDTNSISNKSLAKIQKVSFMNLGEICVSSRPRKVFNESFKSFCGVSRASELLLPPIQAILRRVQKEIGFKYIKFHGILDDDLMVCQRKKNGELFFCFTYVDMIIDFLLETHLKPMIQFSFMPRALASHPEKTVFQKPVIVSPPKDTEEWNLLITTFTNHLLERYGTEEVYQWIFTFWNETLSGLAFDFDNPETALRLYRQTRACVKKCDSHLTFASTSYSALDFPETGYDIFLNYVKENNCLPDVFLFHFYPVVSDSNAFNITASQWKAQDFTKPAALSRDPDIFHKFLDHINAQLPDTCNVPVYITEWNFTPSHREWLNDTCFCSCYIVRNLLQNFHKATGFCHWCLSDLHQELPAADTLFHGGMGLFTENGIPKPSYFAYKFLNSLYSDIIYEQEGCFISTNGRNFTILLYNYTHFTNLYGHGIAFDVTPQAWERAFPEACRLNISFNLKPICNGTYIVSQQFVNPFYGSAFEEWISMGCPKLDKEEEKIYLLSRSYPGFFQEKLNIQNQCFSYEINLTPHEIRLIKLEKKNS